MDALIKALFGLLLIAVISAIAVVAMTRGRLDQQEQQIHDCAVEGQMEFLKAGRKWEQDWSRASGNQYIRLCMDKSGYDFNFDGIFCWPQMNGGELFNKYCYRSKNYKFFTDIDIAINGGFANGPTQLWCERMRNVTKSYCSAHGWFAD